MYLQDIAQVAHDFCIHVIAQITMSGVVRSMDPQPHPSILWRDPWIFFPVGGPVRDETGEMHRRTNALIHGWGKYPWMINFYEWGQGCNKYTHSSTNERGGLVPAQVILNHRQRMYTYRLLSLPDDHLTKKLTLSAFKTDTEMQLKLMNSREIHNLGW